MLVGLVVAVALPAIQDDLGLDEAHLQWVITAYVLVFGCFLLLGGRLADLYGRRRVMVAGFAVFAVGSLLAGLAPTAAVLLVGRAGQGLGAAAMAPAALALLAAAFPQGRERDTALGIWSAVAALVALGVVDESRDVTAPRRLDLPGAATVTAGLALLILAITSVEQLAVHDPATPARVALPLAASLGLLAAFVVVERRRERHDRAPLVRLSILRDPGLAAANLTAATLPVGLGAVLFLGTLHLQTVLGYTALRTGLAYLAVSLPVVAASPVAPRLIARLGRRPVAVAGLLLQAAGLLLLLGASPGGSFWLDVLPGFALVGVGAPVAAVPVIAAAVDGVDEESGLASGLVNAAQQVGNALALALLATVAATVTDALAGSTGVGPDELVIGFRAGFVAAAGLCALGALTALRLPPHAEHDGGPAG